MSGADGNPLANRLPEPPRDGLTIPPQGPRAEPLTIAESPRLARLAMSLVRKEAGALQDFWSEVAQSGTPLIEGIEGDAGHRAVTFLHRSAGDVEPVLLANKLTTPDAPETAMLTRLAGSDVYALTLRLPADLRSSYSIGFASASGHETIPSPRVLRMAQRSSRAGQVLDDDSRRRWLAAGSSAAPDPLARNTGTWLDEHLRESVFSLPAAPILTDLVAPVLPAVPVVRSAPAAHCTPATQPAPTRLHAAATARGRHYHVYVPPGYEPARDRGLPLLVMTDGENWLRGGIAARILDWRITNGDLPPLVAVLIEQGTVEDRVRDLAASPRFLAEVVTDILPAVAAGFGVTSDPARTVIAGQSLGGLTAAYGALAYPERFGLALSQSGSFWWPTPADSGGETEWLTAAIASVPRGNSRFHLEVGLQEWMLLGPTRRFRDALVRRGYPVAYSEFSGGHDTACWYASFGQALTRLWRAGVR